MDRHGHRSRHVGLELGRRKNPIQKLRLRDCGVVLLFSGILARIVVQDRPMMAVDWAMVFLGPLFIAAACGGWRGRRRAPGREPL